MFKDRIKQLKRNSTEKILVGFVMFIIGILTTYTVLKMLTPITLTSAKRADDSAYTFINPLLSCDISENKEFTEYKPLEEEIQAAIQKQDSNKVTSVSVYFREFKEGKWFSINPEELYSPASLLKVPVMIAYFKQAELTPEILNQELTYTGKNAISNEIEYYRSPNDIKPGTYTVFKLIESMIKYSDNIATNLLYQAMDIKSLVEVMSDIGIRIPQDKANLATTDFLTVKSYSYLFRLLYNSTYLSRSMSEKALRLLSYNDFPQGIYGGVPDTMVVAQKFGERTIQDNSSKILSRELHDCGIIYYPNHPYLLCIMTKGQDFDALSLTIQSISKIIYTNVDKRYK
jgi:beta-lactamase class A